MRWVFILLAVAIVVLILISKPKLKEIPKTIWTYWNDDKRPDFIDKCINNFRRQNPDWDVRVLNANDIPPELRSLTPQRQSDWVRLHKLKDYGGVWLDASIILTEPLEWMRQRQQSEGTDGFMYYSVRHTINPNYPVIESWCIGAVPQSETVHKWYEEFDWACRNFGNDGDAYIASLDERFGSNIKSKIVANTDWPAYLTVYLSHQKALHVDGMSAKDFSWDQDDTGPYIYHYKNNWNPRETLKALSERPAEYSPKMIKIYSHDRKYMKDGVAHPESIFGKFII